MKRLTFALIILLAGCNHHSTTQAAPQPRTITANSPEYSDVASAVRDAADGDTVEIPVGNAYWSSLLTIDKPITVRGATTVEGGGTKTPTVHDGTVITDTNPSQNPNSGVIKTVGPSNKIIRLIGLTIVKGNGSVEGSGQCNIGGGGKDGPAWLQVSQCHFKNFSNRAIWTGGWVYGVVDNCFFETDRAGQSTFINMRAYGGSDFGHGAWADYPWYGTDKFFFVEDSTMIGNGKVSTSACSDSENGGKRVFRHNYFINCSVNDHGTEGGNRSHRATEIYDNTFDWSLMYSSLIRGGTYLSHDNKWVDKGGGQPNCNNMALYRLNSGVTATTPYLPAAGDSPWDQNDEGGKVFDSGTASVASTLQGSQGTITDSTKHWTPNQWAGYEIKNASEDPSKGKSSFIQSNTPTTITLYVYTTNDRGPILAWSAGARYEIRRVMTCLDQLGRGRGELLKGGSPPTLAEGGQHWPNEALEPCYSWNNVYVPTDQAYGFASGMPTIQANRDYYNLGKGLPEDTIPPQVQERYTAEINGAAFTKEFEYPHPLRASWVPPTPSPGTPTPRPSAPPASPTTPPPIGPSPTPAPTAAPSAAPTTPPPSGPPAAPSGLAAHQGVTLTWVDNATNETGYQVTRGEPDSKNNCQFTPLVSNLPPDTTTYTDSTAESGKTYCYRVRAEGRNGNFSGFSEIVRVTVPYVFVHVGN